MKKMELKLLAFTVVFMLCLQSFSQTTEVTFPLVNFDLNAAPRTQLSPMSIKLFDDHTSYRPSPATGPGGNSYGTVLALYSMGNHWENNLYFGADKKLYFRNASYSGWSTEDGTTGGYNLWRTVLDSKSDLESSGLLKLTGSGNHYFLNGNVGIGTASPSVKLQLEGTPTTSVVGTEEIFKIGRALTDAVSFQQAASFKLGRWAMPGGSYESFTRLDIALKGNSVASDYNTDVTVMTLQNNGNVGIGCTNPSAKLTVNGNIKAERVDIIAEVPASDYVFEKDYNLMPLTEVESFVNENKHLPEVPSAAEFKETGYSVGQMDDLLLRKVEELTLYIIEHQKLFEAQQQEIEGLKKQNEILLESIQTLELDK